MTVLFWQSIIALSIIAAFYVSYKNRNRQRTFSGKIRSNAPLLTVLGWGLWTIAMLSGPLMNYQITVILAFAAVSVHVMRSLKTRDRQLSKLEAALADAKIMGNPNFDEAVLREQTKAAAEANFVSKIYPIDGVQNLTSEMRSAIKNSSSRVLIMSGWASEYVMDESFIEMCIEKLNDGVEMHLGFGYNSSSAERKPQWEKKGRSQISELMQQALKEGSDENLHVYEFDNHYKSLVKDSDYFITGSINWLSNRRGKNFERAWKTEIAELADREFDDCIAIMRPKRLILRRKLLRPFIEWSDE